MKLSEIASMIYNGESRHYNINQINELYWGLVAKNTILPKALTIYDKLVAKGATKDNKIVFNDLDNSVYYVTTPNAKVWVETSQNTDILYLINDLDDTIHIRRIFRDYDLEPDDNEDEERLTIKEFIPKISHYEEYHDDEYKYGSRHSIKYYERAEFIIPCVYTDHDKPRLYGDARDSGYIMSYHNYGRPVVENYDIAKYHLEYISRHGLDNCIQAIEEAEDRK